jgi:hypothetical protein
VEWASADGLAHAAIDSPDSRLIAETKGVARPPHTRYQLEVIEGPPATGLKSLALWIG